MMAPGKYSWIQEYKRLLYHTPSVESEVLKQHADQVLHVSFSHNGKMFATCSKDGFIRVREIKKSFVMFSDTRFKVYVLYCKL
jgi:WD40 repeat protein